MKQPERQNGLVQSAVQAMEADGVSLCDALTSGMASTILTPYVAKLACIPDQQTQPTVEVSGEVTDEELETLDRHIALLERLPETSNSPFWTDETFIKEAIARVKRDAVSLPYVLSPATDFIRGEIGKGIIDAWMSACDKKVPRFFTDAEGNVSADESSSRWSPSFYKIAKAELALRQILEGKDILDPYAGSGTSTYTTLAKGIARTAFLSDISYVGGQLIEGKFYDPILNGQMIEALCSDLPSAYKPNFGSRVGTKTADARVLPFNTNGIDFIFTDPPYGVDGPHDNTEVFIQSLPELLRVARFGAIVLMPVSWQKKLQDNSYWVRPITKAIDPARITVAFAHIRKSSY